MFLGSFSLLSLAIHVLSHASSQSVLGLERPAPDPYAQAAYAAPYDDWLFTPVEDLGALSAETFTALGHPSFPGYSVRIKKTVFECDKDSTAYTGYIDIQARHLFFYFFESRNDPAEDDVIFWTNGGPGCASSMGLFMENGPCTTRQPGGPVYNPYSWTANASMFWVDQPIGVGFSYADYGEGVSTTDEAAKDVAAFIGMFFENFSQFKGRALHMASESYGGRYLPVFAAEVYDQNAKMAKAGFTPINLQSIMIGNGVIDFFSMYPSYVEVQCTTASVSPPVSSISTCLKMKRALPLCQKWILESCINVFDALSWSAASDFCQKELYFPLLKHSGLNPWDITKKCEGDPSVECYPVMQHMIDYLSLDSTRKLLGVDPAVPTGFVTCNGTVSHAFTTALDIYHETYTHVSQLLERGVRVLVYAGTHDWICNWISNEIWTLKMPWSGQEAFASQPLTNWLIDGRVVGKTRSVNGLTFATVNEAGHMVPMDKPLEAQVLVQKWLAQKPLETTYQPRPYH